MDAPLQHPAAAALMSRGAQFGCLPQLDLSIPLECTIPGVESLSVPLAIALIELGLMVDADLRPASKRLADVYTGADAKVAAERALTRWWNGKTAHLQLFSWSLHVQEIQFSRDCPDLPWFCLLPNARIPQRTLALRAGELAAEHPQFAQTVIAVLDDAMRYLPEAFTPAKIFWLAQWHYWRGMDDEETYIEDRLACGDYKTREELLEHEDIVTRADLFAVMPEWLPSARRGCSRAELERAARSPLSKDVIVACDAIHDLVHSPDFILQPEAVGIRQLELDTTEGCLLLRWSDDDACERVIDDALQEIYESGEHCEFISATPVEPTTEGLRDYLRKTENMLQMAAAVERLLLLITERSRET